jgi:hypothetical protein
LLPLLPSPNSSSGNSADQRLLGHEENQSSNNEPLFGSAMLLGSPVSTTSISANQGGTKFHAARKISSLIVAMG